MGAMFSISILIGEQRHRAHGALLRGQRRGRGRGRCQAVAALSASASRACQCAMGAGRPSR